MPATKKPRSSRPKKTKPPASEIGPGVFVGGWKDAEKFTGVRLCVLDELPADGAPADQHVRIYDEEGEGPLRANLDRLADIVETTRARGDPVLLFCYQGIRRGPLAGAWYLHRHERISLDEAFACLEKVRPGIEHVRDWAHHPEVVTGEGVGPRKH